MNHDALEEAGARFATLYIKYPNVFHFIGFFITLTVFFLKK
tara:strand:- start:393 stop:515 length:123 start_codon:yes stop_codon:yes gene_type:complete